MPEGKEQTHKQYGDCHPPPAYTGSKVPKESLQEITNRIYDALRSFRPTHPSDSGPWVVETYEDFVILEQGGKYYKVNYSIESPASR